MMNIYFQEGDIAPELHDAFLRTETALFERLGGSQLRDAEGFNDLYFHIWLTKTPALLSGPASRYYRKSGRLDLQVVVPYAVFAARDEAGRLLLLGDKMLTAIRKVTTKNIPRKAVYALFLKLKRRLNPAYDPEGDLKEMTARLAETCRPSIRLYVGGSSKGEVGKTRFGGLPDVPPAFEWPHCKAVEPKTGAERLLPLSFLAQFNCKDLAPYDKAGLLPHEGMLAFFYELNLMTWGFDPRDAGTARVFWFEDVRTLQRAETPAGLAGELMLPMLRIRLREEASYPGYEDLPAADLTASDEELYGKALKHLNVKVCDESSKLLGWPENIQESLFLEADYVTKGYCLGDAEGWSRIPSEERMQREETVRDDWQLLLQLDTVASEEAGFELMFGDCGRIYWLIRTDDLKQRRFDRAWLLLKSW